MNMRHIKHPFGPVIDTNCKILILGSVPSLKSVEYNFYYMHPHNRFWKVMSQLLDEDLMSANINTRASLLLKHHVALYDSIEECDIEGSSDNKIYNIIPADIPSLIANTSILRIFCNGAASYNNQINHYPELVGIVNKLPSTSPANAAFSLDKLICEWREMVNFL